jgi:hypothetical protein
LYRCSEVPSQYYTILNDRIDQLKEELMVRRCKLNSVDP